MLSLSSQDYMPTMAAHYGFEYEFVTYKWPHWLFKQTEKQRIIWAYKILFLDVLFPLSVNRIIYVDADQVIQQALTSRSFALLDRSSRPARASNHGPQRGTVRIHAVL
jgi:hypothetical protein